MTNEERKHLAMTAEMEGNAAVVAGIGRRVKLSEMELICLVNFAEIGLMSIFSELSDVTAAEAGESRRATIEAIRAEFGSDGRDGLTRLATSTAAILQSHRFRRYLAT